MGGTLAALVVLSLAWPAPLPPPADLLTIPGRMDADWVYGFWLPLAHGSPVAGLATFAVLTGLLLAAPWLLRPRRAKVPDNGPARAAYLVQHGRLAEALLH